MLDSDKKTTLRILFLGDIVGKSGRAIFEKHIDILRKEHCIDAVVVNGENSADGGKGITPKLVDFFKCHGVNVITSGNHIWYRQEIYEYINQNDDLIRPANFPTDAPGKGFTLFSCKGYTIAIVNIQGRIFMKELLSCPFKTMDSILSYLKTKTDLIFVDVHAEATSEKMALAYFLDGRVSGLVGTHTHIQTADERILPGGTAYSTDLGMAGSLNSMIGMKKEPIVRNFITQMPTRFSVDDSLPMVISGVWIEVDAISGRAIAIERVRIVDHEV